MKPEKVLIQAIIPSLDNPDARVLNKLGKLPTETAPINRTIEDVLTAMGHTVLASGYLSIDHLVERHDSKVVPYNIAQVQTKALDRNQGKIALADGYVWSDRVDGQQ